MPKKYTLRQGFGLLYNTAAAAYMAEFKDEESHEHIKYMNKEEAAEYIDLFVKDFNNWKSEHGFK